MKENNIRELAKRMNLVTIDDMCCYSIPQLTIKIANKVNELINDVIGKYYHFLPKFIYICLLGKIGWIKLLGDIAIWNDSMLRKGLGNVRNLCHQVIADTLSLFLNRGIGAKSDWLADVHFFQCWRNVERDEAQRDSGLFVVQPGEVDELVLEGVENIVVRLAVFRENNHAGPILQFFQGQFEGGFEADVPVYGNGTGVIEYADGQRGNQVGQ